MASPEFITVTEGESVTLSCVPDDPRVRVEWYYMRLLEIPSPQLGEPLILPSPQTLIEPSAFATFDDLEFQHQLTISISTAFFVDDLMTYGQGQYLCYPQGLGVDSLDLFESPGSITINVLERQYIHCRKLELHIHVYLQRLHVHIYVYNVDTCLPGHPTSCYGGLVTVVLLAFCI